MPLHSKIASATGAEGMCGKAARTSGCSSAGASPSRFNWYFQADGARDIQSDVQRLAEIDGPGGGAARAVRARA
ncbi:hypothetical protein BV392_07900 [Rhodovulum sulfidophilum]|nr:hypothetical protein BV392_07900 [Rhodovulum sulfidophilum]